MGDIRFAICPAVRERKTEIAGQESSAAGSRVERWAEGRMAERTVRYRPRPLILPVCSCTCSLRAYISLGQVVLPGLRERASAPQLIKPARNLYRHYTLFCAQKPFTTYYDPSLPRSDNKCEVDFAPPGEIVGCCQKFGLYIEM